MNLLQKLNTIMTTVLWNSSSVALLVARSMLSFQFKAQTLSCDYMHAVLLATAFGVGLSFLLHKLRKEGSNTDLAAGSGAQAAAPGAITAVEPQFAADNRCPSHLNNQSCNVNVPPIRLQALRKLLHRDCPFLATSPDGVHDWQLLNVDRSTCLEDSMALLVPSPQDLAAWQAPFSVHFRGESGVDASGLKREWVSVVARQLQSRCLSRTANDSVEEYCVAPAAAITELSYDQLLIHYHWLGMFLGKMLLENNRAWRAPLQLQLPFQITPLFYKMLLGGEPDFNDIKRFDPFNYNGIFQTLVNAEPGTVDALCLTFIYYRRSRENTPRPQPLKPGGGKLAVTEANK
jgi:hypothetical protein